MVIKCSDEWLTPLAGDVCALWLLTDFSAAFRKHCWQRASQPSIRRITELDPVFHMLSLWDSIPSHWSYVICYISAHQSCDVQSSTVHSVRGGQASMMTAQKKLLTAVSADVGFDRLRGNIINKPACGSPVAVKNLSRENDDCFFCFSATL